MEAEIGYSNPYEKVSLWLIGMVLGLFLSIAIAFAIPLFILIVLIIFSIIILAIATRTGEASNIGSLGLLLLALTVSMLLARALAEQTIPCLP